jgi:hypothetical protein
MCFIIPGNVKSGGGNERVANGLDCGGGKASSHSDGIHEQCWGLVTGEALLGGGLDHKRRFDGWWGCWTSTSVI